MAQTVSVPLTMEVLLGLLEAVKISLFVFFLLFCCYQSIGKPDKRYNTVAYRKDAFIADLNKYFL